MEFAKRNIRKDESGEDNPLFLCIIGIIIIVSILGVIISYILYQKKEKKLAFVSFIITIIFISFMSGLMVGVLPDDYNYITYELMINTDKSGRYTLYVPYIDNAYISIKSGNGTIDYIEVNDVEISGSNNAMIVTGQDDLYINGRDYNDERWSFSMKKNEIDYRNEIYWVWCQKTDPSQNISIFIEAIVEHSRGDGHEWRTINDDDTRFVVINNGWNEVKFEHIEWLL